jgi:hypothetical protein
METIILTKEHFTKDDIFKAEEYFNTYNDRYEFHGNVEIKVNYSIFQKSIRIEKGDISSEGHIYSKGDISSEGDISSKGDIYSEGHIYSKGDISSEGDISSKGYILLNIKPQLQIGPIGSRKDYIIFYFTKEKLIMVKCGCFWDNIDQFENQVKITHKDNQYAQEYLLAIEYAKKSYELYKGL